MIQEKVKHLLKDQNKKMKDLCAYIQITDAGLRKIFMRDSCELDTLNKISNFFNISPAYFFDDANNSAMAYENSIAIAGNQNKVNSETEKFMDIISSQSTQITKSQEQIDRLIGIIESQTKK